MRNTADRNLRIAKSAIALTLAALVFLSSIITVAAAAQTGATETTSNKDSFVHKTEYQLANGDLLVTKNEGFELEVNILEANEIAINNNGEKTVVKMAKGTVGDALKKADIKLAKNEIAVPSEKTDLIGDTTINIYEGKMLKVTADGETEKVLVPYGKIRESLNKAGYNVDEDDLLNVKDSTKVEDINQVTIRRVTYGEETTSEKIAYETKHKNSDEVELGFTRVQTEGKNGKKLVTRKCKYIDGKKVAEKKISSKTIKKPRTEVVLVGTKGAATSGGAGTFTDMYGNKIAFSQVLTGSGTAYTAPAGAGTATGVPAYHGGVAVNPNIIPYGSKLYIESTDGSFVYGYATAVDTGGALMSGTAIVDCYYSTYNECVNFGRRDVNVYVLA